MVRISLVNHLLLSLVLLAGPAAAYGPEGHHTVGAIADRILMGTNAAAQVAFLLGSLSLENAAVWADCTKGVSETTHKYVVNPIYAECAIYETPEGEAAMEDFVVRNDQQCQPSPGEEICHKGYHYTDIAIQHASYDTSFVGARPTDIVGAIKAALVVLQGGQSPVPFDFKDKREALLILTHLIGDIHQPLHVGAIYLSAAGHRINPDVGTYNPATFTRGGNELLVGTSAKAKLHGAWDAVPRSLIPSKVDGLSSAARNVPLTGGSLFDWPQTWASETLKDAQKAFVAVKFAPKSGKTWSTTLPSGYTARMTAIKTERIEKAGARLAQMLNMIWP